MTEPDRKYMIHKPIFLDHEDQHTIPKDPGAYFGKGDPKPAEPSANDPKPPAPAPPNDPPHSKDPSSDDPHKAPVYHETRVKSVLR
jgi:hypothetical protein